jgi:hypothetical protein
MKGQCQQHKAQGGDGVSDKVHESNWEKIFQNVDWKGNVARINSTIIERIKVDQHGS